MDRSSNDIAPCPILGSVEEEDLAQPKPRKPDPRLAAFHHRKAPQNASVWAPAFSTCGRNAPCAATAKPKKSILEEEEEAQWRHMQRHAQLQSREAGLWEAADQGRGRKRAWQELGDKPLKEPSAFRAPAKGLVPAAQHSLRLLGLRHEGVKYITRKLSMSREAEVQFEKERLLKKHIDNRVPHVVQHVLHENECVRNTFRDMLTARIHSVCQRLLPQVCMAYTGCGFVHVLGLGLGSTWGQAGTHLNLLGPGQGMCFGVGWSQLLSQ